MKIIRYAYLGLLVLILSCNNICDDSQLEFIKIDNSNKRIELLLKKISIPNADEQLPYPIIIIEAQNNSVSESNITKEFADFSIILKDRVWKLKYLEKEEIILLPGDKIFFRLIPHYGYSPSNIDDLNIILREKYDDISLVGNKKDDSVETISKSLDFQVCLNN